MKKIIFIGSLALFACNAFSFPFLHKHTIKPTSITKNHSNKAEDFSGTWTGRCVDEDIILNIAQENKNITLTWIYGGSGYTNKTTFELNKIELFQTHNQDLTKIHIQTAQILGNMLFITDENSNFFASGGTDQSWLNLSILKNGDTIQILDYGYDEEECTLSKSQQ